MGERRVFRWGLRARRRACRPDENDSPVENWAVPIAGAAISKHVDGSGVTVGAGLFAQAGAGNVYNNLRTPFGGQDTLRAQFGVFKFTAGLAWQVTDRLALRAAADVYYASLKQRVFPNASEFNPTDPAQTFFGTDIQDAWSVQLGGKIGALYKPAPTLSLGLTYTPQVKIPFDNFRLVVNLSGLGLGSVTYQNAQLQGLALPQAIAGGVAWQATPEFLVAADVKWLDYRRALRSQTLSASNPDNPLAPPTITNTATLDWSNQTVSQRGLRTPRTTRHGYTLAWTAVETLFRRRRSTRCWRRSANCTSPRASRVHWAASGACQRRSNTSFPSRSPTTIRNCHLVQDPKNARRTWLSCLCCHGYGDRLTIASANRRPHSTCCRLWRRDRSAL